MKTNKNGITLIALIITIIILLILAMVTINILINQGIIGHAQNAVETYDEKQVKEDIALSYDEYKMQKFGANAKSLYDFFREKYDNVTDNGDGSITVSVTSNGKTYTVKLKEDGSMESMTGLSLDKSKITLEYESGKTVSTTIQATIIDISGEIEWSIGDSNVATISSNRGKKITVRSVKEGTTTITAKCGKYTKTCEVNVYLKLPIGEYINYDCLAGVTDTSKLYYKSPKEKNGYGDQEFQVTQNPKWKILGRNDNGCILITTSDSVQTVEDKGLHLASKAGYTSGPEELNNISKIYSLGLHAIGGRSIIVEDISTIAKYTPSKAEEHIYKKENDGVIYRDGTKGEYEVLSYYDEENNEWKSLQTGESVIIKDTYNLYGGLTYNRVNSVSGTLSSLIFKKDDSTTNEDYWLASRNELPRPESYYIGLVLYSMRYVGSSGVYYCNGSLWSSIYESSNQNGGGRASGVRPVVTLSSDVTIGEKVDNVWQIVQK